MAPQQNSRLQPPAEPPPDNERSQFTVNVPEMVKLPPGVVLEIFPVFALLGTVAVTCVPRAAGTPGFGEAKVGASAGN
jgi:hypothetical protein